jgi:hypothetical protein
MGDLGSVLTILAVVLVYLIVVRFMDINEKESFGGVATVLLLGIVVGVVLRLVVPTDTIELEDVVGPIIVEVAKFIALALGLGLLASAGRRRGWGELGGIMDGVVYGATAGLGLAAGYAIVREFTFDAATLDVVRGADSFFFIALGGLADGLFGAVMGAGFGLAATGSMAKKAVSVVLGLVLAIVLHMLYQILVTGGVFSSAGYIRTILGLIIPVAFVAFVIIFALAGERRAIRSQLADEAAKGVVTENELKLLDSFMARRALYWRHFMKGDFSTWRGLRMLHNRQVQLALAEQRAAKESDPGRKAKVQSEVEKLRSAVLAAKQQAGRATT